ALLEQMVAQPRVELGAATALARLGDPAAEPALTRALRLTALRVDAAVALRKMKAEPDLGVLASALAEGDPMARVSAAEAVIVLCDPATPAELDERAPPAAPAAKTAPAAAPPSGGTR